MDTSHPKVKNDPNKYDFATGTLGFRRGLSHMDLHYFAAERDKAPYRLVITSRPHMFVEPLAKIERAIAKAENEDIASYTANHVRHYLKSGTLEIWAKNTDCLFDVLKDARVLDDEEIEKVSTHYSVLLSENMQNTVAANARDEDAPQLPNIHKPKNGREVFAGIEYRLPEEHPPGLQDEFEVTIRFHKGVDSQAADMLLARIAHRVKEKAGWGRDVEDKTQGEERILTVKTRYPMRIVEDLQKMRCITLKQQNSIQEDLASQTQERLPEGVVRLGT